MIQGLIPISESNAIKKVVATLFVPQSFIKPKDLFDKINNSSEFKNFPNKSILEPTTISIKNNDLGISRDGITGFIFESYSDNGKIDAILKIQNVQNKSIIVFEKRNYTSWRNFKSDLTSVIASLSKLIENLYIEAISLTYVDEFKWDLKEQDINVLKIFNKHSQILNDKFLKSKNGTLVLLSQETAENLKKEEKTEVSFNNDIKRIVIDHQAALVLREIVRLDKYLDQKFSDNFDICHESNKTILRDLLTGDCKTLIGLD